MIYVRRTEATQMKIICISLESPILWLLELLRTIMQQVREAVKQPSFKKTKIFQRVDKQFELLSPVK